MIRLLSVSLVFLLLSFNAYADPVVNAETVRAISAELVQAAKDKNISIVEKYMYPGSIIIVDLDPDPNGGESQIGYDEYIKLTQMGFGLVENPVVHVEELSLSVDEENNQATIEEKSSVNYEMMGMKVQDVSVGKTTYGVVNGEIKVLKFSDQLISSGPVE
jgi:hypothetical protein